MSDKSNSESIQVDEKESVKIQGRLDGDENIVFSARQSRYKPGGAAVVTPNTIFLTEKRAVIRNPTRLGLGENIEEYFYHQITNIRLEKGVFSASLIFAIPGMTEISKSSRKMMLWGRDSEGVIDAIPKKIAEQMYEYVRKKIREKKNEKDSQQNPCVEDPLAIIKFRYAKGEITKQEFEGMKKDLQ